MNGTGLPALRPNRPPQGMPPQGMAPRGIAQNARPPVPQGPPQGIAQLPTPAMPQGMQEMAAMELVTDDIEQLDLDPKTEALLKLGEAKELVEAANQVLSPPPENIAQQYQQQIPQGIAQVLAKISAENRAAQGMPQGMPPRGMPPRPMPPQGMPPRGMPPQGMQPGMPPRGMPPRGIPPQGMPPRPMPPQGLGGQPAPNMDMPRAAQGGIVGYEDGGDVEEKDPMQSQIQADAERYQALREALTTATTAEDRQQVQALLDELIAKMTRDNTHALVMQYIDSTKESMAGGGIVSFAEGDQVRIPPLDVGKFAQMQRQAGFLGSANAPRTLGTLEEEDELSELETIIQEQAIADLDRDIDAEQDTAQADYERFMLTPEETAGMEAAQAALQTLRQERFSPEEMRKRKTRAGLRGGARKGLGGFAEGVAGEEEAIFEERVTTGQEEIENYTTLIAQLREDGLGRIEARTKAREIVEAAKTRGMSTAQALAAAVDARRTGELNRASSLEIAQLYANRASGQTSDFQRQMDNNLLVLRSKYPNATQADLVQEAQRLVYLEDRTSSLITALGRQTATLVDIDLAEQQSIQEQMASSLFRSLNPEQQVELLNTIRDTFERMRRMVRASTAGAPTDISSSPLTPNQATGGAIPLPDDEADLVVGQLYITNLGPATWNGTQFTN